MSIWYNGGTIAVGSGSASVVGTSTLFATQVKAGDALFIDGTLYQVTVVTDDTHLTIEPVFAGSTASGVAYYILPTSPDWGEVSSVANDLATFLANRATFFPTNGKPDDGLGGNGSFAVDPNSTPPKLYQKVAGAWDNGTSLGGPMGATGKGYGGTSTDSKTLAATGSMSFTTQSGLAWLAGNRIRIASAAAPTTKWMEGVISSYAGTTLVVTIDKQGSGSGSASDWTFGPAGEPGAKGDTGATGSTGSTGATGAQGLGYGGTSTTSRAIGSSGTMTWNIGTGYAYQNGDLVKITNTADVTKWMKGKVSGYSAGVLSVDISESNGTGTLASWNIGLAGETGSQGIQGNPGANGSNGTSPSYNATSTSTLTPATGSKAFTVASGLSFVAGQRVRAASSANLSTNWMSGIVASYSSTTLTVTVDLIGASPASASDWNISVTGEKGDQGPAGGFGSIVAAKGTIPVGDGTTFGGLPIGPNGTVPIADSTQTYGFSWQAEDAINAGPYWTSSDVASAATCDIGAATTPFVRITGTTTITSLGAGASKFRFVEFTGSLTLTYNGTSLILPGTANIITNAGDKGIFVSDSLGNWKCVAWTPIGSIPREKLSADRTYYVRTDGSDSNNGLSNTSGGAFATIQKAYDTITQKLDLGGKKAIIQQGTSGTLTGGLAISVGPTGGSNVVLDLGGGTLNTTSADAVQITAGVVSLTVQNSTLKTTTSGHCINNQSATAFVTIGAGITFGTAPSSAHIRCLNGGIINISSNYTINGSASFHFLASSQGVIATGGITVTLSGTLAFATAFAYAESLSIISCFSTTFTGGTVTGTRYTGSSNAVISTFAGGANFFPGNSAGAAGTGAQYL